MVARKSGKDTAAASKPRTSAPPLMPEASTAAGHGDPVIPPGLDEPAPQGLRALQGEPVGEPLQAPAYGAQQPADGQQAGPTPCA